MGSLFALAYLLIKPDKSKKKGFVPFPKVHPNNVPDMLHPVDTTGCDESLKPCNDDIDCDHKCNDSAHSCQYVLDSSSTYINDRKVPAGKWCLPKNKSNECGSATGMTVWSEGGSGSEAGGGSGGATEGGKWNCSCKYPQLFGGDDCLTQRACAVSGDELNPDNYLLVNGKKWDGSTSPFSIDGKTSTNMTCNCGGLDSNGNKYINMPGTLTCQKDPCFTGSANSAPGWDGKQCDCGDYTKTRLVKSNVDGKCHPMSAYCQSWNGLECTCPSAMDGQTPQRWIKCNSELRNHDDAAWRPGYLPPNPDKATPKCPPEYAQSIEGGYCQDPCVNVNCGSKGKCSYDVLDPKGYKCVCLSGSTQHNGPQSPCDSCLGDGQGCGSDGECCDNYCGSGCCPYRGCTAEKCCGCHGCH